jgi:hypothetical protein
MLFECLERNDTFVSTSERMLNQTSTRSSPNSPKENTHLSKEKEVGRTRRICAPVVSTHAKSHIGPHDYRTLGVSCVTRDRLKIKKNQEEKRGLWGQKISDVTFGIRWKDENRL